MGNCSEEQYRLVAVEPFKSVCETEEIQKQTGFSESITPIRFRTTVLTDLYDQTKDIKLTQAAAGHATADMTLKHYVKGRTSTAPCEHTITNLYTSVPN